MAHFSKVVDGVVVQTAVTAEETWEEFLENNPKWYDADGPGQWIKTSYNTKHGVHYDPETGEPSADQSKALRLNYGAVGRLYDKELDIFTYPKPPYASWTLDTSTGMWEAPIAVPTEYPEFCYYWNEVDGQWELDQAIADDVGPA
jgi:hypothetical protein